MHAHICSPLCRSVRTAIGHGINVSAAPCKDGRRLHLPMKSRFRETRFGASGGYCGAGRRKDLVASGYVSMLMIIYRLVGADERARHKKFA